MDLKDIAEFQEKFDVVHGWDWKGSKDKKEWLQKLQHIIIALNGEQGEFANVVKKIIREFEHDGNIDGEHIKKLHDELADIFIYVVIAANFLGIDLDEEYFRKMKFNEERFQKFSNKAEKI